VQRVRSLTVAALKRSKPGRWVTFLTEDMGDS
jgi:hypothetical protein